MGIGNRMVARSQGSEERGLAAPWAYGVNYAGVKVLEACCTTWCLELTTLDYCALNICQEARSHVKCSHHKKTFSLLHELHENVFVFNLGHHCIISKHSTMNNDGQMDRQMDGWLQGYMRQTLN